MKKINYIYLDRVDSTNTWAKKRAGELLPFTCVVAKEQTGGRGRLGRRWVSPRGQNIYASFVLEVGRAILSNIGQVMALSCLQVIECKNVNSKLKWPNDLLVGGKKIGGVLTESVINKDKVFVVVGVGLNVNMDKELLEGVGQPATSLVEELGHPVEVKEVLEAVMEKFIENLEVLKGKGFRAFKELFENHLAFLDQEIALRDGNLSYTGICRGLTENGQLQLELPSGEFKFFSAGEVS